MRTGVTLPHMGPSANPKAVAQGAQQAERLGYDSVWVMDRLLYPVNPRNPYPGTPDGSLPSCFTQVLDPIESLTFAAAHTSRVALGTSILDIPFYNPVVLARRLTTLDVPAALRRAATLANGWMPNGIPLADLPGMLAQLREMATTAGRDPNKLEVVVVASVHITPRSHDRDRAPFTGSLGQIKEDVAQTRELGADELIFELDLTPAAVDVLATMERLRELAEQ